MLHEVSFSGWVSRRAAGTRAGVLPRATSVPGRRSSGRGRGSPRPRRPIQSSAVSSIASTGWRSVVRSCAGQAAIGMSSKPAMARSRGTRRPKRPRAAS
ncbi:hypothetical protein CR165_08545 [Pseudoroseomonas aestuarii]|uniref:Uncharacterized protein n=1 Tax=Teichococcus aestuarii TaxID=568898 RepID=A0A2U1V5P2_9PROT|nr:hypothetical protein CR165_08545 [Pseudoroseomonas aestuarii]